MALSPELEAIKDAMDKETGDGRDYALAVSLSDEYVGSHPELFAQFEDMSIEDCVAACGVFRDAGLEEEKWRVEVWIKHRWDPQQIGGEYKAQVRMPGL